MPGEQTPALRTVIIMSNTLRDARRASNLSQVELAIQAGVTRHSIIRLEQHCYPHPLPNVIATLSEINGASEAALISAYEAEVKARRAAVGNLILSRSGWLPLSYVAGHPYKHLFAQWRIRLCKLNDLPISAIQFSQLFSIHPAVLSAYESWRSTFPRGIETALLDAGCPVEIVNTMRVTPTFNKVKSSYNED